MRCGCRMATARAKLELARWLSLIRVAMKDHALPEAEKRWLAKVGEVAAAAKKLQAITLDLSVTDQVSMKQIAFFMFICRIRAAHREEKNIAAEDC